jgi:hypothetical protein
MKFSEEIQKRLAPKMEYKFRELQDLPTPKRVRGRYPSIIERWIFLEYQNKKTEECIILRLCRADYQIAKRFVRQKLELSKDWVLVGENDEPVVVVLPHPEQDELRRIRKRIEKRRDKKS